MMTEIVQMALIQGEKTGMLQTVTTHLIPNVTGVEHGIVS